MELDVKRELITVIKEDFYSKLIEKKDFLGYFKTSAKTGHRVHEAFQTIIKELQRHGAMIKAYDPVAMDRAKSIMPDIEYCEDAYSVAKGVDAIALITEWDIFKELDLEKIKSLMRQPVFFDGRNVFEPEKMRAMGFIYEGIGR